MTDQITLNADLRERTGTNKAREIRNVDGMVPAIVYGDEKETLNIKLKLNEWKKDLKRSNNEAIAQASMDDNSASADIVDQASSYTEKKVEMRAINRQIKLITKIDGAVI